MLNKDLERPNVKLLLVSSSGGHWEQLQKLGVLFEYYEGCYVTEKTPFLSKDAYTMAQTDLKDKLMPVRMLCNTLKAIFIWVKEKPDVVITTGTMIAYPFYWMAYFTNKKFIFIDTFGRSKEPTIAGLKMQKHSDLFFVQWETQREFYDNAIYIGSLY